MIRKGFVTAKRKALFLAVWCTVLWASPGNAAISERPHAGLPDPHSALASPATPEMSNLDRTLTQNGIAPGSAKAHMLTAWFEMVLHDPDIAMRMGGGPALLERIFLDEGKREALMSSGLARVTPQVRLLYLQLFTRLLDEFVPVNCFGLVDMNAVMNHITLGEMSDADAALYLQLLYRVLVSSMSDAPVRLPTPQEYAGAMEELSRAIVIELDADTASLDRYGAYTRRPSTATPSDVCWTTRVTLHAIAKMPESARDIIFLTAITASHVGAFANPAEEGPGQVPRDSGKRMDEGIP